MPTPVPWASGPTNDPATLRLREEACRILRGVGPSLATGVASAIRRTWGQNAPPVEWLIAALVGEPRLWRLPDGRWVHLPSTLYGRALSCATTAAARSAGVLPVDVDVATALLPFDGWQRMPVTGDGWRGLAERAQTPDGRDVLVLPRQVPLWSAEDLLVLEPGPEGLSLAVAAVDEVAEVRTRRALAQLVQSHPPASGPVVLPAPWPRAWSALDVGVLLLAEDPSARRSPVQPLSAQLGEVLDAESAATLAGP